MEKDALPQSGVLASTAKLWQDLLALLNSAAALVAIEARKAGISLAIVVGLGLGIGLLAAAIWFLLLAAGIAYLIETGLAWSLAFALAALLNLVLGVGLFIALKQASQGMMFEVTRRQLFGAKPDPQQVTGPTTATVPTTASHP